MIGDSDGLFDEERERTPIAETPIVLNPKVDAEETILECPECEEEIECWASNSDPPIIEYRCGCDDLRRFKIKGVPE